MFHHGLTLKESAGGARSLAAISLAVIGIVATAPLADPEVKAALAIGAEADNDGLTFTSKKTGKLGNATTIALVDPAANDAAIAVAVDGDAITVSLATDAGGAITTTAAQLLAAIEADAAATALVGVADTGASDGSGIVAALPATALAGGVDEPFPLNEPVLITGGVDIAAGKAGDAGTLGPTLTAIGDQASPVMVVVRVAEDADQAQQEANVIGATDGNVFTGLQALKAAETKVGVKPRILGAPGLDSQAVAEELAALAKALRGFAYVGAKGADGATPADDIAEALLYRDNFAHRELMVIWPDTAKGGGDNIARALGLRSQIDEQTGWHKTLSNVPLVGVTGLARDIAFDLVDPSTDAGVLNAGEVTTIIRQTGFRFWGNRTCADPTQAPEFAFESAVRTSHALQDICAQIVSPYIDQPMTIGLVKDLLETGNGRFRQLAAEGKIIGAKMFFDPDVNSAEELAAGRPRFRIDFTPVAPLENPNIDLVITDYFYAGFADQLI